MKTLSKTLIFLLPILLVSILSSLLNGIYVLLPVIYLLPTFLALYAHLFVKQFSWKKLTTIISANILICFPPIWLVILIVLIYKEVY